MIRLLIGILFLSASWFWGLEYYYQPQVGWWIASLVLGTCLLPSRDMGKLSQRWTWVAVGMLIPVLWIMPWPYLAGPVFLILGMILRGVPIPRLWPQLWGGRFCLSGMVLVWQALILWGYQVVTGRSHEIPVWMQQGILQFVKLLGVEAAVDAGKLALFTMRQVFRLSLTWELVFGPMVVCFVVGLLVAWSKRDWRFGRGLGLALLVWLPLQVVFQIVWLLQRALRTGYDETVNVMAPFWSPWIAMALLGGLIVLLFRFLPKLDQRDGGGKTLGAMPKSLIFMVVGMGFMTFGIFWQASGPAKQGRIWVDEYHSTWEPTGRPYDTEWYGHDSGYNYACLYDYCDRYFTMDRLLTPIEPNTLAECDVLMVKVPTSRYSPEEIEHLVTFVNEGGGLLLIGEHTNVFNTGTYLNDIAKRFGFFFRDDCLFDIDSPFEQLYEPSFVPHPVVQHMSDMHFAVSCSVDPGWSPGRAAIRSTGLRNLPAHYHASNYYPQVEDRADTVYGAFVQLWAQQQGLGRVLAFTDSTIFSNFSAFEPGKSELMLGMLNWLNRTKGSSMNWFFFIAGLVISLWGVYKSGRQSPALLLCAGLCGWALGIVTVRELHATNLPAPELQRPYVHVVMDRTLSDTLLPKSGFIAGDARGFGIFERWILRLGYFTSRAAKVEALQGDLLIVTYPTKTVTETFRKQVLDYVMGGGKVLVIDSPSNPGSTANSLLYPFGLKLDSGRVLSGNVRNESTQMTFSVQESYKVEGGEPLLWLSNEPVVSRLSYGEGSVSVVGFGQRFSDARMGVTGDVIPDPTLRAVFDLQFELIRNTIESPVEPNSLPDM